LAILAYIIYKMYRQSHKEDIATARVEEVNQNAANLAKEAENAAAAGVNPGILTPAVSVPVPPAPAGSVVVSVNEKPATYNPSIPYAAPSYSA
jgi:hypothetical protein